LGCYLGASLSIKDWWKENYGWYNNRTKYNKRIWIRN
jgi:hypothetical protein